MSIRSYVDAADQVVAIAGSVHGVRISDCKPFVVQLLRYAGEKDVKIITRERLQALHVITNGTGMVLSLDVVVKRLQVANVLHVLHVLEGRYMLSNNAYALALHVKQGRDSGKWRRPSGERPLQALPARA